MGFVSILGRLLFAYIFILSAWEMFNDFGDDGGDFAWQLAPKFSSIQRFLASKIGDGVQKIDGIGAILFVFDSITDSITGAYLLMCYLLIMTPVFYDFYNYESNDETFHALLPDFVKCYAILGALVFFIGIKNELPQKVSKKKKKPLTKTA